MAGNNSAEISIGISKASLAKATRDIEQSIVQATHKPLNLKIQTGGQPLGRISRDLSEFNKSLAASNARVLAFGASAGIIYQFQRAMRGLVDSTIKVEKSLTAINAIIGTSQTRIKQFGGQLFDIARATSSSFEQVSEAALEFARQGLTIEETAKRTRDAMILVNQGGIKAADAVKTLTAVVNGFSKAGVSTYEILNKMVSVDQAFAVSTQDLAQGLSRAGATASNAKVSLDELFAIITTLQQTTARGGAIIGNGLKSIFTRLQRTEVLDQLRNLGVVIEDTGKKTLPATQILLNLADTYKGMSDSTRSFVAEQVAGVYQINLFQAAMEGLNKEFSIYAKALIQSKNASNEAILRQQELNKTVSARYAQTLTNMQRASAGVGEIVIKPTIDKTLDYANTLFDSINNQLEGRGIGGELGGKIAKGILKGIGDALAGPGLILIGATLTRLVAKLAVDSAKALREVMGTNNALREQQMIQDSIYNIMQKQPNLWGRIQSGAMSVAQAESLILKELKMANAEMKQMEAISRRIGGNLVAVGAIGASSKTGSVSLFPKASKKTKSLGHVPPQIEMEEKLGALRAGYAPGKVEKIFLPSVGTAYKNSAEDAVYAAGFAEPFINPPRGTDAALRHTEKSMQRHGINPYALNEGFIPNLANLRIPRSQIRPLLQTKDFQGITYAKASGEIGDYHSARWRVRRDKLVGADAPAGYQNWTDFDEKTNSLVLHSIKSGEDAAKFRRFKLDGIRQIRSGGNVYDVVNRGFVPNFAISRNFRKLVGGMKTSEIDSSLSGGHIPNLALKNILFPQNFTGDRAKYLAGVSRAAPIRDLDRLLGGIGAQKIFGVFPENMIQTLTEANQRLGLSTLGLSKGSVFGQYLGKDEARLLALEGILPPSLLMGRPSLGHTALIDPSVAFERRKLPTSLIHETAHHIDLIPSKGGPAFLKNFRGAMALDAKKYLSGRSFNETSGISLGGNRAEEDFAEALVFGLMAKNMNPRYERVLRARFGRYYPSGMSFIDRAARDPGSSAVVGALSEYLGSGGHVPNMVSPNFRYALGYGQFRPNPFSIKDIFQKGGLKKFATQLPFRVAGSAGAYLASLLPWFKERKHTLRSAGRYLAGLGGVRNIEYSISNPRGSFFEQYGNVDLLDIFNDFGQKAQFESTGDLRYALGGLTVLRNKHGVIGQDPYNFDNSQDITGSSKLARITLPVSPKIQTNKYVHRLLDKKGFLGYGHMSSIFGSPLDLIFHRQKIYKDNLYKDLNIHLNAYDLNFAKYGSPFLSRMKVGKSRGHIPNLALPAWLAKKSSGPIAPMVPQIKSDDFAAQLKAFGINVPVGPMTPKQEKLKKFFELGVFDPSTGGTRMRMAGGHVPNMAYIPLLTPMVGRVITNLVKPYGYSAPRSLPTSKDFLNALFFDKPRKYISPEMSYAKQEDIFRDFAFREMFGLKPRLSKGKPEFLDKTGKKTYSFKKDSDAFVQILQDLRGRMGNPYVVYGDANRYLGGYRIDEKNGKYNYFDRWDFDLQGREKIDWRRIPKELKGIFKGDYFGPHSVLLIRHLLSKITSPITMTGQINSDGGIPNMALKTLRALKAANRKDSSPLFANLPDRHPDDYDPETLRILNSETGSALDFRQTKRYLDIKYITSLNRGDARAMFEKLYGFATKRGKGISSETLIAQRDRVQKAAAAKTKWDAVLAMLPQLRYRIGLGKTSGTMNRVAGENIRSRSFSDLDELKEMIDGLHVTKSELIQRLKRENIWISDVVTKPNFGGFIPNMFSPLSAAKEREKAALAKVYGGSPQFYSKFLATGYHPTARSGGNPSGQIVYNTLQERNVVDAIGKHAGEDPRFVGLPNMASEADFNKLQSVYDKVYKTPPWMASQTFRSENFERQLGAFSKAKTPRGVARISKEFEDMAASYDEMARSMRGQKGAKNLLDLSAAIRKLSSEAANARLATLAENKAKADSKRLAKEKAAQEQAAMAEAQRIAQAEEANFQGAIRRKNSQTNLDINQAMLHSREKLMSRSPRLGQYLGQDVGSAETERMLAEYKRVMTATIPGGGTKRIEIPSLKRTFTFSKPEFIARGLAKQEFNKMLDQRLTDIRSGIKQFRGTKLGDQFVAAESVELSQQRDIKAQIAEERQRKAYQLRVQRYNKQKRELAEKNAAEKLLYGEGVDPHTGQQILTGRDLYEAGKSRTGDRLARQVYADVQKKMRQDPALADKIGLDRMILRSESDVRARQQARNEARLRTKATLQGAGLGLAFVGQSIVGGLDATISDENRKGKGITAGLGSAVNAVSLGSFLGLPGLIGGFGVGAVLGVDKYIKTVADETIKYQKILEKTAEKTNEVSTAMGAFVDSENILKDAIKDNNLDLMAQSISKMADSISVLKTSGAVSEEDLRKLQTGSRGERFATIQRIADAGQRNVARAGLSTSLADVEKLTKDKFFLGGDWNPATNFWGGEGKTKNLLSALDKGFETENRRSAISNVFLQSKLSIGEFTEKFAELFDEFNEPTRRSLMTMLESLELSRDSSKRIADNLSKDSKLFEDLDKTLISLLSNLKYKLKSNQILRAASVETGLARLEGGINKNIFRDEASIDLGEKFSRARIDADFAARISSSVAENMVDFLSSDIKDVMQGLEGKNKEGLNTAINQALAAASSGDVNKLFNVTGEINKYIAGAGDDAEKLRKTTENNLQKLIGETQVIKAEQIKARMELDVQTAVLKQQLEFDRQRSLLGGKEALLSPRSFFDQLDKIISIPNGGSGRFSFGGSPRGFASGTADMANTLSGYRSVIDLFGGAELPTELREQFTSSVKESLDARRELILSLGTIPEEMAKSIREIDTGKAAETQLNELFPFKNLSDNFNASINNGINKILSEGINKTNELLSSIDSSSTRSLEQMKNLSENFNTVERAKLEARLAEIEALKTESAKKNDEKINYITERRNKAISEKEQYDRGVAGSIKFEGKSGLQAIEAIKQKYGGRSGRGQDIVEALFSGNYKINRGANFSSIGNPLTQLSTITGKVISDIRGNIDSSIFSPTLTIEDKKGFEAIELPELTREDVEELIRMQPELANLSQTILEYDELRSKATKDAAAELKSLEISAEGAGKALQIILSAIKDPKKVDSQALGDILEKAEKETRYLEAIRDIGGLRKIPAAPTEAIEEIKSFGYKPDARIARQFYEAEDQLKRLTQALPTEELELLNKEFLDLRLQLSDVQRQTNLINAADTYNQLRQDRLASTSEVRGAAGQFRGLLKRGSQNPLTQKETTLYDMISAGVEEKFGTTYQTRWEEITDITLGSLDDIKGGFSEAFRAITSGSDDAGTKVIEAFTNMLARINDRITENAFDNIFRAVFKSALPMRVSDQIPQARARGGKITGGSGVRDDVPAYLMGGEYVIKKSMVEKYGEDFLKGLNEGRIPAFKRGGLFDSEIDARAIGGGYGAFLNISPFGKNIYNKNKMLSGYAIDNLNWEPFAAANSLIDTERQFKAEYERFLQGQSQARKKLIGEVGGSAFGLAGLYAGSRLPNTNMGDLGAGLLSLAGVGGGRYLGSMFARGGYVKMAKGGDPKSSFKYTPQDNFTDFPGLTSKYWQKEEQKLIDKYFYMRLAESEKTKKIGVMAQFAAILASAAGSGIAHGPNVKVGIPVNSQNIPVGIPVAGNVGNTMAFNPMVQEGQILRSGILNNIGDVLPSKSITQLPNLALRNYTISQASSPQPSDSFGLGFGAVNSQFSLAPRPISTGSVGPSGFRRDTGGRYAALYPSYPSAARGGGSIPRYIWGRGSERREFLTSIRSFLANMFGSNSFAFGGPAKDNIPALLTAGEFVVNRKAVDRYGKPFFDALNQGRVGPRMYNEGGYVTGSFLNKNAGDVVGVGSRGVASNNVQNNNNVSISVNVSESGKVNTSVEQSGERGNEQKARDPYETAKENTMMAKQIEAVVMNTMAKQSRPGGFLYRKGIK